MELTDEIRYVKGVGPAKEKLLKKLGIVSVHDLLLHIPRDYEDRSSVERIADIAVDTKATVLGAIVHVAERRTRRGLNMLTAVIDDGSGVMQLTWFGKEYLKEKIFKGKKIFATGKISYAYGGMGRLEMANISSFDVLAEDEMPSREILPVYAATEKLTQKFLRQTIKNMLDALGDTPEIIPPTAIQRYNLMERNKAFHEIHFPATIASAKRARDRLAFEELFLIQCGLYRIKNENRKNEHGIKHITSGKTTRALLAAFPFALTDDQKKAWREIESDMEKSSPMRRLLQGDVGSGKTALAMLALAKTAENGFQGAMMAPTEILAMQHYENFRKFLTALGLKIGFLSGHLTKKQREKIYGEIERHELDIVIGTHALIQKDVAFKNLGLTVTDEQHRFGVRERAALEKKSAVTPDMLVMTATPIPRTMTLTLYGDLDVSVLRELPPGRKPVRTFLRGRERRRLIYEYVRQKIDEGRQAYVVCPRIEADEESDLQSAEEIYDELATGIFAGVSVGLLHGKMKAADKEKIMESFAAGETKLLVATTVVEVGINVPNACMMIVENAERFGLAQLHQLRGRVGRGEYQSFCVLVSDAKNDEARERLGIMERTADGFELAQKDLELRGPGEFFGRDQHGLGDLKIADALRDINILLGARRAAQLATEDDAYMEKITPHIEALYGKNFLNIRDY